MTAGVIKLVMKFEGVLKSGGKIEKLIDEQAANAAAQKKRKAATFIPSGEPASSAAIGRKARKSGVRHKLEVPDWKAVRDAEAKVFIAEEKQRKVDQQRIDLMEIAKMQLGVFCRKNSIDDAECQRIADRLNYERSPKNHLKNPKPLKTKQQIIA